MFINALDTTLLCFLQYLRGKFLDCCKNFKIYLGDMNETVYVKDKYVTGSHKMRLKSQYAKLRKWCLKVV